MRGRLLDTNGNIVGERGEKVKGVQVIREEDKAVDNDKRGD